MKNMQSMKSRAADRRETRVFNVLLRRNRTRYGASG